VFNTYGPGQSLPAAHPPVVPHFLRQASRGGTIVIHGRGAQTRDFVYIDDVVEALVAAATAPTVNRQVINIGSGVETSVRDLAQRVLEVMSGGAEWIYKDDQDVGSSRMCADLTLARAKLGYVPRVTLQDGLERMLARDLRFQRTQPTTA
jgi:UDP-glucose 4-epimerase